MRGRFRRVERHVGTTVHKGSISSIQKAFWQFWVGLEWGTAVFEGKLYPAGGYYPFRYVPGESPGILQKGRSLRNNSCRPVRTVRFTFEGNYYFQDRLGMKRPYPKIVDSKNEAAGSPTFLGTPPETETPLPKP